MYVCLFIHNFWEKPQSDRILAAIQEKVFKISYVIFNTLWSHKVGEEVFKKNPQRLKKIIKC